MYQCIVIFNGISYVLALDDDFSFMDLEKLWKSTNPAPGKGEVCLETAEFLQRLT